MSENGPSLFDIVRNQEQQRKEFVSAPSTVDMQTQRERSGIEPFIIEPAVKKEEKRWLERAGGITIKGETVESLRNAFKKNKRKKSHESTYQGGEKGRKAKRNSKIISGVIIGGVAAVTAAQALKGLSEGHQGQENPVSSGEGETEEQITQNLYAEYDFAQIGNIGLERTGIDLGNLNKPDALINKPFLRLAARWGDDFLIPPVVDQEGKAVQEVSEAVVADWVEALNLNPTEVVDFRQNYVNYRTHPEEFAQYLLDHGASRTVVNFLLKAEELKTQDTDPASWYGGIDNPPDRYEKLQQWLSEKGIIIGKTEEIIFSEIVARMDPELNAAVEQMMGPMETLGNMPIDTTEMHEMAGVDMADFYQHELQKPLLANTGLPLVLTGLFLLRVGPAWPKAVIAAASDRLEKIYYWLKLGQGERAIRDLTVIGKQAWERVTGKKITREASR